MIAFIKRHNILFLLICIVFIVLVSFFIGKSMSETKIETKKIYVPEEKKYSFSETISQDEKTIIVESDETKYVKEKNCLMQEVVSNSNLPDMVEKIAFLVYGSSDNFDVKVLVMTTKESYYKAVLNSSKMSKDMRVIFEEFV